VFDCYQNLLTSPESQNNSPLGASGQRAVLSGYSFQLLERELLSREFDPKPSCLTQIDLADAVLLLKQKKENCLRRCPTLL
jgi:hypothetical protein